MPNSQHPPHSPATDATSRERRGWRQLLGRLESKWLNLGLARLWNLRRTDFYKHIKQLNESTGSETLFDQQEHDEKRAQLLTYLKQSFVSKMQSSLRKGLWGKIFRKQPGNIEDLRKSYQARGRHREFDGEFRLFQRKTEEIQQRQISGLYDQQERATRLMPQVRIKRRLFRHRQKLDLRMYSQFHKLTRSLPDDDLDLQLEALADSYHLIGRSREWFHEFEKMIDEVFDLVKNVEQGQNESFIRLLQNDFLLTMQGKFSGLWRYYELREFCFEHDYADLITRFGYFQNSENPAQGDTPLTHFVQSIETAVRDKLRTKVLQTNLRKRKRQQMLSIDHEARLAEWVSFKQHYMKPESAIVATFNHLKPILNQCAEWQHDLKVFRALIKVNRLADNKRKGSEVEREEVDLFIRRMVTRVDSEIATEVAFKVLEQNLIQDEAFLDDLNRVRQNITIAKESRISESAEDVTRIKQAFIQAIWEKRASSQQGAPVTALFSRRISGKLVADERSKDRGIKR